MTTNERSQCADQNDPDGFFVRFAPTSGGILLDMSVHDIDGARPLLAADKATRVYATGTIAIHEGLAACNDVDNAVAIIEFEGGSVATLYAFQYILFKVQNGFCSKSGQGKFFTARRNRLRSISMTFSGE